MKKVIHIIYNRDVVIEDAVQGEDAFRNNEDVTVSTEEGKQNKR